VPKKEVYHLLWLKSTHTNEIYLVNFVNNKAKWWYCVRYVRILLFLIICFSQGSVATRCRCGGKYNADIVANLLLSPTVKEFKKSDNICQSYEWISIGTFLVLIHWLRRLFQTPHHRNGQYVMSVDRSLTWHPNARKAPFPWLCSLCCCPDIHRPKRITVWLYDSGVINFSQDQSIHESLYLPTELNCM